MKCNHIKYIKNAIKGFNFYERTYPKDVERAREKNKSRQTRSAKSQFPKKKKVLPRKAHDMNISGWFGSSLHAERIAHKSRNSAIVIAARNI